MGFDAYTPIHVIYEGIFLNVSIYYNIKWTDMLYANKHQSKEYACRVVSMILLCRALQIYKRIFDHNQLETIMGKTNFDLVCQYCQID
jgi:hypothetical protein